MIGPDGEMEGDMADLPEAERPVDFPQPPDLPPPAKVDPRMELIDMIMDPRGPVGRTPTPGPSDMPMYAPPTNPNVEVRNDPAWSFRAGPDNYTDELDTYLPAIMKDMIPAYRSMDLNDTTFANRAYPSRNPPIPDTQMARDLGREEIEQYANAYHMRDPVKNWRLQQRMEEAEFEGRLRKMPDYIQRRYMESREAGSLQEDLIGRLIDNIIQKGR